MNSRRSRRIEPKIPTASMADIALLLLIFFMTTTMLRMEEGFPVELPDVEGSEITQREEALSIWVDKTGRITVGGVEATIEELSVVVKEKVSKTPELIVSLLGDENCPYHVVSRIIGTLGDRGAFRVSFVTEKRTHRGEEEK